MAFTEPVTITIDGTASLLNRISTSENKSVYSDDEVLMKLTASHAYTKRTRRVLRLDVTKTGADPIFPDQNQTYSNAIYLVLDVPKTGFTTEELTELVSGFAAAATTLAPKWVTGQN